MNVENDEVNLNSINTLILIRKYIHNNMFDICI